MEHQIQDRVLSLVSSVWSSGALVSQPSEQNATLLVGRLCKKANDEEMSSRPDVISEIYNKGKIGKPVRGISQLGPLYPSTVSA